MKKILFCLTIISFLYSCNNPADENKEKYESALAKYISQFPIKNTGYPLNDDGTRPLKRKIAYPLYHVFFNKKENREIMTIKLAPHYTELNINLPKNNKDSLIFSPQKAKGWYMYNGNPIIIFDSINISENYISKQINIQIPDSLKLQEINNHIDSQSKVYILSKYVNRN